MSILSYKTKSTTTLIQEDFDTVLKRNLDQHIELVRKEETRREVISSCIIMCEIGKLCNITSMGNVRNLIINKAIEIDDSDLKVMLCAEIAVMDFGCLYTCENNVTILEQRITEIHNKLPVNQNSLPCMLAFFVSCTKGLKEFVCETGKIDEIRSIVKLVWNASANDEIIVPEGMN
ncbi:hypothetical protein GJ496_009428 [Pomphorhynchus laevis]|nr:hypothetical protein GJ496_009428 [Pomphorhynchus laevis]